MNYSNYASVLAQLQAADLQVDVLDVGARRRVRTSEGRERRGWYHLHELPMADGRVLLVGSYGVWQGNDNGARKIALGKGDTLSDEQQTALRARIAADRKASDAARQAEVERAAGRAQAMWRRLSETGESEYLARKRVAPHGVRFADSGAVVLPLLDAHGKIYGLQAIYPRGHPKIARTGRDKDFWPAGLAKQGHFFLIGGSPARAGVCMIAEGYATAATAYQAMTLPVAVAFDAGNIVHVAAALRARYPKLAVLVLADDDYLGKCRACGQLTLVADPTCSHCGQPHLATNAGVAAAQATALADRTSWLAPRFAVECPVDRKGPTDFNDLHVAEGLGVVFAQIEGHLTALGWRQPVAAPPAPPTPGGGEGGRADLTSVATLDELHQRYALVYEAADTVFDAWEHKLVPLASMRNICTSRQLHRAWMDSMEKRVVRVEEVGFDPGEQDAAIKCNLWAGWPTRPQAGNCERLLELGEYLCSLDERSADMWAWLQRWLAYPVQHPGAKMKTAVIMHGPQGTGKNLFFEAVLSIYGIYGQVVDQDAIEDKHNDFMSRKLMLVADEVVARMEMFHAKNKLKGLVTSDWISINPKFVARYRERNHCQLVFLSNEVQPMALERDDRRYAVIWTPTKWEADIYNAVLAEIRAGGVAALHHYLLNLPLGDFGPATLPPMTQAKEDLIELGMDSSERFWAEWTKRYLPLPCVSARTEDLYGAYRHWCSLQGVTKPAQLNTCVGAWAKRPGARKERARHMQNYSHLKETQSQVIHPPGVDARLDKQGLTDSINRFNEQLTDWKKATSDFGRRPPGKDTPEPREPATAGDDDAPY